MRLLFPVALWRQRELLAQLVKRDIQSRYRGSALGWGWSLLTPLLTLGVYTFVFSQIFKSRWGGGDAASNGPLYFAINLFAGLIVFTVFAETASSSPDLIASNPNLVKKVVFPLEILPVSKIATSLFHACTSLAVLACFQLVNILIVISNQAAWSSVTADSANLYFLWLPVVWLPLVLFCLGIGWILSAIGVYLRDLSQIVSAAVNLTIFLSTVFYPISALPSKWAPILRLNPLVSIIEQTRNITIGGKPPTLSYVGFSIVAGIIFCELAFRLFNKARAGFNDII